MDRRNFLKGCTGALVAATAAATLIPQVAAAVPSKDTWVRHIRIPKGQVVKGWTFHNPVLLELEDGAAIEDSEFLEGWSFIFHGTDQRIANCSVNFPPETPPEFSKGVTMHLGRGESGG